ncbi:MAG: hypothetical protein AB8F95_02035 [Bacteroidia bacterium]
MVFKINGGTKMAKTIVFLRWFWPKKLAAAGTAATVATTAAIAITFRIGLIVDVHSSMYLRMKH